MGRTLWVIGGVCLAGSAYSALKVWRMLSHYEPIYPWLSSVTPPPDYNHKRDTANTREFIRANHSSLLRLVDRGTLDLLERPHDDHASLQLPQEVYICGTAHIASSTAQDVYDCILEVKPQAVVVELCRSRSFMMFRDPKQEKEQKEKEKGKYSEMGMVLQACKQGQSILQVLLGWIYFKVEEKMQVTAGMEFIKAREAIEVLAADLQQLQHQQPQLTTPRIVQVFFGDVGVQQTLSRCWGVLNVRQKLKLVWCLFSDLASLDIDEAGVEALLQEDVHQLIQKTLGPEFSPLLGPLLHERNAHLARTVVKAAEYGASQRVVVVVGKGHVPGLIYCLMHPWAVRMRHREWQQQQQQQKLLV